jgi:acyl transferase domain-containing protein
LYVSPSLQLTRPVCHLPDFLDTPSRLWEALLSGISGRGEVPKSRLNIDAFYHSDPQHPARISSHEGYFLDNDVRKFDHEFFNINSMEARYMDPQQRQLLEVAFECIESAGITLDDISAKDVGC